MRQEQTTTELCTAPGVVAVTAGEDVESSAGVSAHVCDFQKTALGCPHLNIGAGDIQAVMAIAGAGNDFEPAD